MRVRARARARARAMARARARARARVRVRARARARARGGVAGYCRATRDLLVLHSLRDCWLHKALLELDVPDRGHLVKHALLAQQHLLLLAVVQLPDGDPKHPILSPVWVRAMVLELGLELGKAAAVAQLTGPLPYPAVKP